VGSDDDGYPVRLRFEHFLRYATAYAHHGPADDSPLYIFDGTYGEKDSARTLLSQYSVPHLFPEDIFALVGERRRPPYRCGARAPHGHVCVYVWRCAWARRGHLWGM
jgi:histone arginine demethylase JMJD6